MIRLGSFWALTVIHTNDVHKWDTADLAGHACFIHNFEAMDKLNGISSQFLNQIFDRCAWSDGVSRRR
jgi:hypothetical protein